MSKKSTKKKKAKKRDISCYNILCCDISADISSIAVIENSTIILEFEIKKSIVSKHIQDATETRTREILFFNRNFSRSQITKIFNITEYYRYNSFCLLSLEKIQDYAQNVQTTAIEIR